VVGGSILSAAVPIMAAGGAVILGGGALAYNLQHEMQTAREENFLHSPALKLWDKLSSHPNFHKCNASTLVPRQPKRMVDRIRDSLRKNGLDSAGCPLGELFPVEEVNEHVPTLPHGLEA
jgi:hypothetical protein